MAEDSLELSKGRVSLDRRRPYRLAPYRREADGMMIGEIAEQLGTTVRALRYYEGRGLLNPARKSGGMRRYTPTDRREAELIVTLRMLGLSLNEIRKLQSEVTEGDRLSATKHILLRRRGCLLRSLALIDVLLQDSLNRDGAA
jgi:DNA-binding transcriptional MerR regulator